MIPYIRYNNNKNPIAAFLKMQLQLLKTWLQVNSAYSRVFFFQPHFQLQHKTHNYRPEGSIVVFLQMRLQGRTNGRVYSSHIYKKRLQVLSLARNGNGSNLYQVSFYPNPTRLINGFFFSGSKLGPSGPAHFRAQS